MGKEIKIWGVRGSLLGDALMAVPVLHALERRYPGSYKYWQVARKCAHAAPLYLNHPLIDQLVISDCDEGMGPRDIEIAKTCQVVLNVMPGHPDGEDWPNRRNIYEETFIMAGLPLAEYHALPEHQRRPILSRWFTTVKVPGTIAIWPCAGYGRENKRNPSQDWYEALLRLLVAQGFAVHQYGHPADYTFAEGLVARHNDEAFFDQVKATLTSDLVISTDSGSGLIFAAYEHPQITLLTNHWPGHVANFRAFAPLNPHGDLFFGLGNADLIDRFAVMDSVARLTA